MPPEADGESENDDETQEDKYTIDPAGMVIGSLPSEHASSQPQKESRQEARTSRDLGKRGGY